MIAGYQLHNGCLWLDGVSMRGVIEEITPPKLTAKTEDFYAGGMDGPVPIIVGMEGFELSFSIKDMNTAVLENFGLQQGNDGLPVKIKGGLQKGNSHEVKPFEVIGTGLVTEVDMGSLKPGEISTMSVTLKLNYYKLSIDNSVKAEIDLINMKRVINGVDQLKQMRDALGF
ncbi:phage major tail tube protein [Zooshikella sp. RANM57]|uniref:phage major tail tube protein n=1 Tax=Zooshikella sp. RANM57 TaxID=3425863 RepID=UPI003D6E3962